MNGMVKMSSYGKEETQALKENLEHQLQRLVQQLEDLDGCKDELDPEEYDETKRDTIDQMKELDESLQRMVSGDMTLVDDLGAMQLAIHAVISKSFEPSAAVEMFGRDDTEQLRKTFTSIQLKTNLGEISREVSERRLREILMALKRLGENLTSQEMELLDSLSYSNVDTTKFVQALDHVEKGQDALAIASQELQTNFNF